LPNKEWVIANADDYERRSGATHIINNPSRYYGFGYERGGWSDICGVLMSLFASTNVGRIWYFGDNSDPQEPITVDQVLAISRLYMEEGNRPYTRLFNNCAIPVEG